MIPHPGQRGGSAKSSAHRAEVRKTPSAISRLSLETRHRTSATVTALFDMELRALRRDRAARIGPELFLFERTFEDCLERIALGRRKFERALVIGCPDQAWPGRLREIATNVDPCDPGRLFAEAAGGASFIEDEWSPAQRTYDLVLAIGTLDTVNDLPGALRTIVTAMRPGSLFIGAMSGGDTLPQLRTAMRAADAVIGGSSAHVHPRIEAPALAPLLSAAGFINPVVDIDRVQVAYSSLGKLVSDLRAMGATNVLTARSRRPLLRAAREAADRAFELAGNSRQTYEIFEILHFAVWTPTAMPIR
jgi:NADH dehydrogenase [ubiquinone] 1 alpha subcomplex assembly factor 5